MDHGFVFNPFDEFFNADVDPAETSWRGLEWPDHIQSPACKGPRCRDRLQDLSRDVDLFGNELAVLTSANEGFSICHGGRLIEASLESLSDQCSRGCAVAAGAGVDLFEYLLTFFHGEMHFWISSSLAFLLYNFPSTRT